MGIDWFPLWLSLRVAALSTLAALFAGPWLAWLLARREFRGKNILDAALALPLILPPTVLGYYLLVLLGRASPLGKLYEWIFSQPLMFTWQAAVLAAIVHSLPFFVHSARTAMENADPAYERAARSLGASEWRVFWQVSLPLAWNPILAALAITFARSLGDFGITLLIAGNTPGLTQTLPVAVYDSIEHGRGNAALALALAASAIALALFALARRAGRLRPGRLLP
jgi:molybdate transport system permease protein